MTSLPDRPNTAVLVSDAHTTDDYSRYGVPSADKVIAHTNMYWSFQTAPQREASVIATADLDSLSVAPPNR